MNVICEWGLQGLRASAHGRVVIIIDILSFSTATTIAVSRGATIFPCEWNHERAEALARSENAELASKRGAGRFSLAPASLRDVPRGQRLVLPSPNGSTLACAVRALDAAAVDRLPSQRGCSRALGCWPAGRGLRSHEAEAAAVVFEQMRGRLGDVLVASRSGVALIEKGYPDDIAIASELDADNAVPLLTRNAITLPSSS